MSESLPVVLIPGLLLSWRTYAPELSALWAEGGVMLANHTRADTITGIERQILADAPLRFALAGLSMGGYLSFEILRQAPERVARVAFLDTSARADTPEVVAARRAQMELASAGRFPEVVDALFTRLVHASRHEDRELRALVRRMGEEVGLAGYLSQQAANIGRPDSRPGLADIRCPALVVVGDSDILTPPERAAEIAQGIRGAELVIVPECGHLSTLERPEVVTDLLRSWLAR